MGTRSRHGYKKEDGSYITSYCHWDGYLSHNGKILLDNYNTNEKVKELVELGDLSILGSVIGEKTEFDVKVKGQCTAYRRDRGECWNEVKPLLSINYLNLVSYLSKSDEEYLYIWQEGEWYYCKTNSDFNLKKLTIENCQDE